MALGDIVYIGWSGSPSTKELTPRLNYVPSYDSSGNLSDVIVKQLVRTIYCYDRDKQTVVASLQANTTLSLPTIDANGAVQSTGFTGDWKLTRIDDGKLATGISVLTVTYEQESSPIFMFNLPAGVTLTQASGVSALAYNGTALATWDSGRGVTSSGLMLVCDKVGADAVRHLLDVGTPMPYLTYTLQVDGVEMSTHQIYARDMSDSESIAIREDQLTSIMISDTGTYTLDDDGNLIAAGDAYERDQLTQGQVDQTIEGTDYTSARSVLVTSGKWVALTNAGLYKAYFRKQVSQVIYGRITDSVPNRAYGRKIAGYMYQLTGKVFAPAWELNTSENYLRIHVAGATIMRWGITGL